ncbi:MAG: hypothetical protein QNJ88_07370 [Acidimicrobiia bacterium]|nr:hypothetical protein [Acidimicrobiia bacterium]
MLSPAILIVSGAAFMFMPTDLLISIGAADPFEFELVRWAGLLLVGQAILVARMNRKRIIDDRWYRVALAGDLTVGLAIIYVVTGNPFFLILGFSALFAIYTRTLMPVLDHWSRDVRSQWERKAR